MDPDSQLAPRLARLPTVTVGGHRVAVADTILSRLFGLALIERDRAGSGLLIPDCRSIHTFGMRFAIEVVFLDAGRLQVGRRLVVEPGRFAGDRRADSVLELVRKPGEVQGGEVRRSPN